MEKLFTFLLKTWGEDIRTHQLASVLRGVGPMKTIEQFVHGIFDLFWLPIQQYNIDGRIVRGLQLGAQSFTTRTVLAALEITTRLIQILQVSFGALSLSRSLCSSSQSKPMRCIYMFQYTAETAYDIVSPGPSARRLAADYQIRFYQGYLEDGRPPPRLRRLMPPPQDIREGVSNALAIVCEGVGDTAQTICRTAALEHDQKGVTGAVGAVLRQIPPTVVRPLVLATQATSNVLGGVRNQLMPDAHRDESKKWKDVYE